MKKKTKHVMQKLCAFVVAGFILTGCGSTPKTQTTLIKPDPCALPPWPETPDIWVVKECPEGLVCITLADQLTLWHHEADVIRMKEYLDACPWVKFVAPDDPKVIQGPTPVVPE